MNDHRSETNLNCPFMYISHDVSRFVNHRHPILLIGISRVNQLRRRNFAFSLMIYSSWFSTACVFLFVAYKITYMFLMPV